MFATDLQSRQVLPVSLSGEAAYPASLTCLLDGFEPCQLGFAGVDIALQLFEAGFLGQRLGGELGELLAGLLQAGFGADELPAGVRYPLQQGVELLFQLEEVALAVLHLIVEQAYLGQ